MSGTVDEVGGRADSGVVGDGEALARDGDGVEREVARVREEARVLAQRDQQRLKERQRQLRILFQRPWT